MNEAANVLCPIHATTAHRLANNVYVTDVELLLEGDLRACVVSPKMLEVMNAAKDLD